jgi:hypothetical protein
MRNLKPPFKFDLSNVIKCAKSIPASLDGVSISLPFISFTVKPEDKEKQIAREVIIRMADRRVLNALECCDNCVKHALSSLQEIRRLLVDKQVELSSQANGSLYLILETMLEAIRQFFTFTEGLDYHRRPTEWLDYNNRPRLKYFAALDMLRAHLFRALTQVSKIADIEIPKIPEHMRYEETWASDAYEVPDLSD